MGKNDGSITGERFFTCKPQHGSFIRPDRIDIGDFPVLNELEDMEEIRAGQELRSSRESEGVVSACDFYWVLLVGLFVRGVDTHYRRLGKGRGGLERTW